MKAEELPRLRELPRSARRGLVDMVYNLGIGKFPKSFPSFTKAALERNWLVAVEQCRIKSPHENRRPPCV